MSPEGAIDVEPLVPSNQSTLALEARGESVPAPAPAALSKPVRKGKPWRDFAHYDGNGNRVDGHSNYSERNGAEFNDDPLARFGV